MYKSIRVHAGRGILRCLDNTGRDKEASLGKSRVHLPAREVMKFGRTAGVS